MTEIEFIVDFHKDAERQGPGSAEETKKALDLIDISNKADLKIADIGCGTGAQTITLAQNTNSHVVAVDIFKIFLDKLSDKAQEVGLQNRITPLVQSMEALDFRENEFDIIWSEGAIYNMGFENGVRAWRRFLKPEGYLAVTEISWITDSRPEELENYWKKMYPGIGTISNNINALEKNGYTSIAHFILPSYCWIDNYYNPMQDRFEAFLENHDHSELAQKIVESEKKEIALYNAFKDFYGYVFYIAKKK